MPALQMGELRQKTGFFSRSLECKGTGQSALATPGPQSLYSTGGQSSNVLASTRTQTANRQGEKKHISSSLHGPLGGPGDRWPALPGGGCRSAFLLSPTKFRGQAPLSPKQGGGPRPWTGQDPAARRFAYRRSRP